MFLYNKISNNMGNQTQKVSRFAQKYQWLTIAKTNCKEIIQNKLTREIVEIHRVTQAEADQLKGQNLVYEWRKDPKSTIYTIQILEINQNFLQQNKNCIAVCQNSSKPTDLVLYTQNLLKLYEMNSKLQLSQGQQIGILKDIIQGIDVLATKFGQFLPSKDSVGYNAKKRGKVWINDNFCLNNLQQKRPVSTKQDRLRWQRQVIETLVDISKLCTTQNNYRSNKFYFALQTIKKNKLYDFNAFRQFKGPERKPIIQEKKQTFKAPIQPLTSKRVQMTTPHDVVSSNQFGTAQDPKQRMAVKNEIRYINKTFDVPMMSPTRNRDSNFSYRTTYNQHNPQLIKFTPKEEKQRARQNFSQLQPQPSFLKQGYINLGHKKNTSYLVDNMVRDKDIQTKKSNCYTKKQVRQRPPHYALLQQLQESRSSRSESKMIKRQTIQLVDSMQMVENRHEYDGHHKGFHRYKNTVLEQSIIIKAPYM